jgi:hypothetical protein
MTLELLEADGINDVQMNNEDLRTENEDDAAYDLSGRPVRSDRTKGLIIKNNKLQLHK